MNDEENWLVKVAKENRRKFMELTPEEQKNALDLIEKRRQSDPCYRGIEKTRITVRSEFRDSPRWKHVQKSAEEVRNWPEWKQRARIALRYVEGGDYW